MEEREYIDPADLRSTYEDISAFNTSNVWTDFLRELSIWVQQIRGIQDESDDEKELYRCQGRIEAIGYFQRLPSVLLAAIEQSVEETDEREDGSDEYPEDLGRYGR